MQGRMDRARGMEAFGAAPQDHGITRLEAKRTGIRGHIRARFIDHADDTQRRAHALDVQTRRLIPFGQHLPHGIILCGDAAQAVSNGADTRIIQQEPVHHRVRETLVAAKLQIFGVRVQNIGAAGDQRVSGFFKRGLLLVGTGKAQCRGGGFGARANIRHQRGNVVCLCHIQGHNLITAFLSFRVALYLKPSARILNHLDVRKAQDRPDGSKQHAPARPEWPRSQRIDDL